MPPKRRRRATVVKTYTPESVQAAFGHWLADPDGGPSDKGELRMFCPLCEEPGTSHSPSASINPALGKWNCLKTDDHGGAIGALARELGVQIRATATRSTPQQNVTVPPALEDQDKPYGWHDQFMAGARSDFFDFLTQERGLHPDTLRFFKVGTDGDRITLPIRFRGKWRQVRRYLPHAVRPTPKILNIKGFGRAMLAYSETLTGNTLPVVVTAGELDALLLWQEAAGALAVVTGTGGEGTVPRDLSALRGREVFVAYDLDDAGRKGAQKFATAARSAGAHVHVLDLARLGLSGDGADVSDYLLQGGTVDALMAEMESLRGGLEDGLDDVLATIQQMFLAADDVADDHLAEGLTDDQIAELDPPRFAVYHWLQAGFFSDIYGAPGVMKTYGLLDIALHVRAGIDWHGHATDRGAVLLYEGEGLAQMRDRLDAWKQHYPDAALAPSLSFQRFVDLTRPEGVAAVARTVRRFEARTGVPVRLVIFDPLVEFMTGDENGEGTELATRGLRALAQYLDIAVLVAHHSNAAGDRARGADFLRMRAGAHIRMERLEDGMVGLVQEKQKNSAPLAMILQPVEVAKSLVLDDVGTMPADAYSARKTRAASAETVSRRIELATVARGVKDSRAQDLLIAAVRAEPGIVQGALLRKCMGREVGHDLLLANLERLAQDGRIRVGVVGSGKNAARRHYLADGEHP